LECSSENAPQEKPKTSASQAKLYDIDVHVANVLGDVTNTSCAGQLFVQRPPTAPDATYASKSNHHEKGSARLSSMAPTEDVDGGETDLADRHAGDPQHVAEYAQDIFRNLQRDEPMGMPSPSYMERQVQVNAKMRAILIDWLVDVHKKYKLHAETLFLAVSLIDRYLDLQVTAQRHLQLVGVTALLIAAKFEEVYPPLIKDFVYVTDKAYTREDIVQMEVSMLRVLQFKICQPTAVNFLERYQIINGCTDAHRHLAQYLLELTLVDYKMIKYAPSHLAAAAILLSNKLLGRPAWTPAAVRHTRFTESMLRECAKEMCYDLEMSEQSQLQAIRKKFSQQKYHTVATLNFMAASIERANPTTSTTSRRMSTGCRRSSSGVPMDIA
jgi:cyclin B